MQFKPDRRVHRTVIFILVFTIGLVFGISAARAGKNNLQFAFLPENITSIEGVLAEDPRVTSGGNAMAVLILKRCGSESLRGDASGRITVFFPNEGTDKLKTFGRGTSVFSEGSLRYSAAAGDRTFSAESIHITKTANPVQRMRTNIRLNLTNRFGGKEWGGLALALLLGIRDNLDSNLSLMYRKAGCSFILALSGMHLAVLAATIAFVLRKPLGLKAAALTGAVIICLYCFIVGPMPSLNRAALMYLLGTAAILWFLPREPLSVLSLSFLIQILITPNAGYQISFMLSYLALLGIFLIGQPLYNIFAGKVPDILMQPLSASCGAFLATTGITGSSFGYLAPIGIIAGLFLVPVTTLFMILSLAWLILDFLSISIILNWPLSLLYKLMEGIISLAAKVPAIKTDNSLAAIFISIILSIFIIIFEYYQRKRRLSLEPF